MIIKGMFKESKKIIKEYRNWRLKKKRKQSLLAGRKMLSKFSAVNETTTNSYRKPVGVINYFVVDWKMVWTQELHTSVESDRQSRRSAKKDCWTQWLTFQHPQQKSSSVVSHLTVHEDDLCSECWNRLSPPTILLRTPFTWPIKFHQSNILLFIWKWDLSFLNWGFVTL